MNLSQLNVKVVAQTREDFAEALEEMAEQIRNPNHLLDYIGEIECDSGNEAGFSYSEDTYSYADIYGNDLQSWTQAREDLKNGKIP